MPSLLPPRVVVERLDSLGQEDGSDSLLCGDGGVDEAITDTILTINQDTIDQDPLRTALAATALEEETYPGLSLNLTSDMTFDLCSNLDTPINENTDILDSLLAATNIVMTEEEEKWTKGLVDLFPELD